MRYLCTICRTDLTPGEFGTMRVTVGNRSVGPVCPKPECQTAAAKRLQDRQEATS